MLATGCLLGLAFGGPAAAVVDRQATASLYEEALIRYQEKDLSTAVIHLKNALKSDPDYLAAHLLLGRAYLEQGEGALAERELATALRLGADRALVMVPLANAYNQQRKYRQLLDTIHPGDFLPTLNAEILQLRGSAYLELGEIPEAEQAFERAAQLNPDASGPLLGQVSVLMRQGQFERGGEVLQQAMTLAPEDVDVWRTRGDLAHARHRFDEAVGYYGKALELAPGSYKVQVSLASVYMDMGRYQQALGVLQRLDEGKEFDPQVPYLRGVIHSRLGDSEASRKAMLEASSIMAKLPTEVKQAHPETLLLSSLIDYSMNRMDEAYAGLEAYIRRQPGNPGARKLMGSILSERGQYDRAIKVLQPALEQAPEDYRLLTLLGTAYVKMGRHLLGRELLERAAGLGGDGVEARTQIGLSLLAQGQRETGMASLAELFAEVPAARQAGMTLVLEHLRQNENRQAVAVARQLNQRYPDDLALLNLLASSEIAAGEMAAATAHLESVLQRDGTHLDALLNLAKIDRGMGRYDRARQRLQEALTMHPGNTLVLVEQARLEESLGRPEAALELLLKALALDERVLNHHLYLQQLYLKLGRKEALAQHMQTLERLFPDDIQALRAIGVGQMALGNPALARNLFRRVSKLAGYNIPVLMDVMGLLRESGDLEGATWALMKVLEEDPGSVAAQVALAEVQLAGSELEPAAKTIDQLIRRHPQAAEGYRLLADLKMGQGDIPAALDGYRKSLAMREVPDTRLKLYRAYLVAGDLDSGIALLESWLEQHPRADSNHPFRKALAEGYLRVGDMGAAEAIYGKMVEAGSQDPGVYNNLALIRFQQSDPRGLALARKAQALAPEDPSTNDTLGWILVNSGQPAEGLPFLRNASLRDASSRSIRFHIARALFDLGRGGEAAQGLRSLLAEAGGFADREAATALLRRIEGDK